MAHDDSCSCTVNEVLDRYLRTPSFAPKTRVLYASNLVPVREVMGGRLAREITEADVDDLCALMTRMAKTSGPGKGDLKSRRSIQLTAGRLWAALAAHGVGESANRASTVYVIAADGVSLVKIGRAVNVAHRLQNLQSGSPVRLSLLGVFEGRDGRVLERSLHLELAPARKHGEWFDLGPDPLAVVNALVQI